MKYLAELLKLGAQDRGGSLERIRARIDRRRDRVELASVGMPLDALYRVELTWQPRFHELIGASWPCDEVHEFDSEWSEVKASITNEELAQDFDTDRNLALAVWCAARHLRPKTVIETGVARGVTSRILLEAFERNGDGKLYSVDLPHPKLTSLDQIGSAVPERLRHRWELILGSARRCLPELVARVQHVDLFVHDSLHTRRNVVFELETIWRVLSPDGVVVVDDIDWNLGFCKFTESHASEWMSARRATNDLLWGVIVRRDGPRAAPRAAGTA